MNDLFRVVAESPDLRISSDGVHLTEEENTEIALAVAAVVRDRLDRGVWGWGRPGEARRLTHRTHVRYASLPTEGPAGE